MAQFGIHGDPAVSAVWRNAQIPVDAVEAVEQARLRHLRDGRVADYHATTQVFINFRE